MSALSPLSGEEGHEMLGSSLSAFDPSRTSAAKFCCDATASFHVVVRSGRSPKRRAREAARFHRSIRRRGGDVAARGKRAAARPDAAHRHPDALSDQ